VVSALVLAANTSNDNVLDGVRDWFHSGTWLVIRNMVLFFIAVPRAVSRGVSM
jgi:hypothetical protein